MRFEVKMAATITTYRIVTVEASDAVTATKRAMSLTSDRGFATPTNTEDIGDWCDSTMPSRRRVESVKAVSP